MASISDAGGGGASVMYKWYAGQRKRRAEGSQIVRCLNNAEKAGNAAREKPKGRFTSKKH